MKTEGYRHILIRKLLRQPLSTYMHHNVFDRLSSPLFASNNDLVLFYVSHIIVLFFFLLICFLNLYVFVLEVSYEMGVG